MNCSETRNVQTNLRSLGLITKHFTHSNLAYRATGVTRACSAAARQGKARLGAPVMQDRAVKWAVRVVLEVGRRSGGLLPDDSGTDEAALAAQGVDVAHGVRRGRQSTFDLLMNRAGTLR